MDEANADPKEVRLLKSHSYCQILLDLVTWSLFYSSSIDF